MEDRGQQRGLGDPESVGNVPVRTKVLPASGRSAIFVAEIFSLFGSIPSCFIR